MTVLTKLDDYKRRIDAKIDQLQLPGPYELKEACLYALKNGGKRFRPAIIYMVAESLGAQNVDDAALAVELFHTASLIADDLPCMDNDLQRRGKPTLHRAFDEKTAILATYALISEGYDLLRKNTPVELLPLVIQQASKNTGLLGATSGQYFDLMQIASCDIIDIHYLKTAALFELSFVLGWLLGNGDVKLLDRVVEAAYHFGIAFQVADDIDDHDEDVGRIYNFAREFGICKARERVENELAEVAKALGELGLSDLYQLAELLS